MNISAPFIRRPVATTLLTHRAGAGRGCSPIGLLPVAPLPQVEFPTIQVSGGAARRQPGDDGVVGGDAARAPVRPHRRRDRDDLDQLARLDDDRAAVRPGPRHRRAARDVQAAINAARGQLPAEPAEQSDLPQGQSGRRADHDPGADLRH